MIIVDMEMPKSCKECIFQTTICEDDCCIIGETIPGNATNGDIMRALFPNEVDFDFDFNEKWWNAPYKAESEEDDSDNLDSMLEHLWNDTESEG